MSDVMMFNGLKGAQLVAYIFLLHADLSEPISIQEISNTTCYAYNTLKFALWELDSMGLIERERDAAWLPYRYKIKD